MAWNSNSFGIAASFPQARILKMVRTEQVARQGGKLILGRVETIRNSVIFLENVEIYFVDGIEQISSFVCVMHCCMSKAVQTGIGCHEVFLVLEPLGGPSGGCVVWYSLLGPIKHNK